MVATNSPAKSLATFADAMRLLVKYLSPGRDDYATALQRVRQFMAFLGNPQNKPRVVHVAGTSGKTSTAHYIAALLRQAGYEVGLMVSPHIHELNERVQINGTPLAEKEFCVDLTKFMKLVQDSGIDLKYTEILYSFAYWEFAAHHVDFAVVETGVGGTLDATNVVSREDKVCVITDIGLDHQKRLGHHVREIAAHKAGIIQLKNAVFCYRQPEDILGQIQLRASMVQADLHLLEGVSVPAGLDHLPLFQQRNMCLALAAVRYVLRRENTNLTTRNIQNVADINVPGRMEILNIGGKTVILDGAHNPQKMRALAESIRHKFPGQKVAALFASADKDDCDRLEKVAAELVGLASRIITTSYKGGALPPAVDPQLLAAHCKAQGHYSVEVVTDVNRALTRLTQCKEPILLITGSLYFMSSARQLLV
jgi:dihydrofolate synthase / folylpolyglutamate synthase